VSAKSSQLEQNIFDLTAKQSIWLRTPHAELLINALRAIADDELSARFSEKPAPTVFIVRPRYKWWRLLIKQAIFSLEKDPHFFVNWFRCIFVNLDDYSRWQNTSSTLAPAPQPEQISQKMVEEGIKTFLKGERAEGRQGSQKSAWKWAKANIPGSRYSQVIKALEIARGKRERGRPQTASRHRKST
jgi:hypothetical protein